MRDRTELAFASASAVLPLLGAVVLLRLWQGDLGIPLEYFGDVNLQHLLVRSVIENGWFYENARLGAPGGQELYDYPVLSGDTLNVVVFWLLGLVGLGSAAALNLFYLLTFPAAGLAAYLVLRRLGAEQGPSLVCSVLYGLAPFHFIRGETHLWLSAYYAVPIGAYLALAVLGGDDLLGRRRGLLITGALAAVVALASGSFYYSAFTVVLVAAASLLRFVGTRERRALLAGGFVVGVLVAVSLVQLAPTIAYRAANGRNEQVAKRFSHESEVYSLKLTQLVFPLDEHRIDAIGRIKRKYSEHFPPGDARAATLGVVASAGLFWLFGVAFAALAGRRPRGRHAHLAALALTAFLFATVGGLGTLVSAVWSQTRAWNRLSIFIAFFALAAVALGLGALRRRLGTPAFAAVLAAVLAVGLYDQTSDAFVPAYGPVEAQWEHDRAFVRSLEDRLPERAMVVQLPYETFPEPPAARQAIYEPVKPYLHSSDLRWSYGAMRGRPADWLDALAGRPASEVIAEARERGFAGLLVDRLGYADDGAAVEAELGVLGAEPLRSPNGRFLFFGL
jgi:phosphoglycerol transferase